MLNTRPLSLCAENKEQKQLWEDIKKEEGGVGRTWTLDEATARGVDRDWRCF
jgi:hypothetical protein